MRTLAASFNTSATGTIAAVAASSLSATRSLSLTWRMAAIGRSGPSRPLARLDGYRLYASHTTWESEEHFKEWTRSEAFRAAHRGAGDHGDMYLGPPQLECFESVQSIER